MSENRLKEFRDKMASDLDKTMDFWLRFSHDEQYGGFFTCLTKDGTVYDETKYCWLQGRQVWTYAKLYNEVERFRRPDILNAAKKGGDFLMKYVKNPHTWKCYFTVTRDGRPIKIQRSVYSETFYLMALSELGKATGEDIYKTEALEMMKKVLHWARVDDSELGRPKLSGAPPTSSIGVPMVICNLIDQLISVDASLMDSFRDDITWCVSQVLAHIQREGSVVLENVTPDGKEIRGSAGRLVNAGHAMESGWFLMNLADRIGDKQLKATAIANFIDKPFESGWDEQYGGILNYQDADGLPSIQMESNMKLWWPHNEALIAFMMAYKETRDIQYLEKFAKVYDYSYSHFVDEENGGWFGYLDRHGDIALESKGGSFKGCFHVPRCLMICEKILNDLLEK